MRESDVEDLASHGGPESCGAIREGGAEALTGVRAGWVLSRVIQFRAPTPFAGAEGNTNRRAIASICSARRGRRPRACTEPPRARTGRSSNVLPQKMARQAASGRPRPEAEDEV